MPENVDFDLLPVIVEEALDEVTPPRASRHRRRLKQPMSVAPVSQAETPRSRSPPNSRTIKISDELEMILPPAPDMRLSQSRGYQVTSRASRFQSPLSVMYLEPFRGNMPRNCSTCKQNFAMRELRLGFMLHDLTLRPKWIHVGCARRARLHAVGQSVSHNPTVSESALNDALEELGHVGPAQQSLVPWSYLPASVQQWPSQILRATPRPAREDGRHLTSESEQAIAAVLAALPCSKLTASLGDCAICHQAMAAGEMVCSLPCTHAYHVGCIDAWLRIRTTCPLDNQEIQQMLMPECETTSIHYSSCRYAASGIGLHR